MESERMTKLSVFYGRFTKHGLIYFLQEENASTQMPLQLITALQS
jgi:hypothetical protein